MTTKFLLVTIAPTTGSGLPLPAPVACAAVPSTDSVYIYADEDGEVGTWIIRSTCGPDCIAYVTTGPGKGFAASLVDGRFTVTRMVPGGLTCPPYFVGDNASYFDGGTYPVIATQWWDPVTLTGEVDFLESDAPCGLHDRRDTFTLTQVGE